MAKEIYVLMATAFNPILYPRAHGPGPLGIAVKTKAEAERWVKECPDKGPPDFYERCFHKVVIFETWEEAVQQQVKACWTL